MDAVLGDEHGLDLIERFRAISQAPILVLTGYGSEELAILALLAPSADPRADARDPRWTTQRAAGSLAFVARYVPRRGHRRIGITPQ